MAEGHRRSVGKTSKFTWHAFPGALLFRPCWAGSFRLWKRVAWTLRDVPEIASLFSLRGNLLLGILGFTLREFQLDKIDKITRTVEDPCGHGTKYLSDLWFGNDESSFNTVPLRF